MAVSDSDFQRVKEKVEVLNGDRRQALDQRAFRYGEIRDVQEFIARLRGGAEELGDQIEGIGAETQQLLASLTRLSSDVDDIKGDTNILRQRIDKATTDIGDLQSRIKFARMDIDAIAANTSTVELQFNRMRDAMRAQTMPTQQSSNISAAPTAAQYNDLVADVAAILAVITRMRSIVSS